MPGPRPKPTKTKLLHGEKNRDRINQNEPPVPEGVPDCPGHLDAGARDEWGRICADLQAMGLSSPVHRPALAAYCTAYSRWIDAEQKVQEDGFVMLSKDKK